MEATVAKLKKKTSAEVWVCLRDYQGQQYVDVREYFLLVDDRQWHPTRKGIMIPPTLLAQVIDGVEALNGVTDVKTVATIRKSARDEILVAVREYEGNRYGEIRIWYRADDGEMRPAKGVTFKLDMIDGLLEALRNAEEHLDK
jgi:transcriptional coactivator p15 (PC4)